MSTSTDTERYLRNLAGEQQAIYLYEKLAEAEANPHLAEIYRRLAATEGKHAALWKERLREAGIEPPGFNPSLRSRIVAWLGLRLGVRTVLPIVTTMEHGAYREYDTQPEAVARNLPLDERSHARMFRYLSAGSAGISGGAMATLEGRHRGVAAGNALRAGVLGANDGLVSNLSLVMGVAGAEFSSQGVLVAGLAGLLAGSLSMAIGEWVSVRSAQEMYEHQLRIETDEIAEVPEEEEEELALIYQAKGMPEADARSLAKQLLQDPKTALETLAREELGIDPEELGGSPWEAAVTSFLLFAGGATIPVLPFVLLAGNGAVILSASLSAVGLFLLGGFITIMTGRNALYSGARQALFGLVAAAITFGIGRLVGVTVSG